MSTQANNTKSLVNLVYRDKLKTNPGDLEMVKQIQEITYGDTGVDNLSSFADFPHRRSCCAAAGDS
jgi:hypothetical protein